VDESEKKIAHGERNLGFFELFRGESGGNVPAPVYLMITMIQYSRTHNVWADGVPLLGHCSNIKPTLYVHQDQAESTEKNFLHSMLGI
jgi:hypothetical protein